MHLVREIVFEVWQKRERTNHDSPAIGAYETFEVAGSKAKIGEDQETQEAAQSLLLKTVGEYAIKGWKVNIAQSSDNCVTMIPEDISDDLVLWIGEKIVSEKPLQATSSSNCS